MDKKPERKRLLTPDLFEVTDNGEVIIKDADLASRIKNGGNTGETPGEQGIGVGVIITD